MLVIFKLKWKQLFFWFLNSRGTVPARFEPPQTTDSSLFTNRRLGCLSSNFCIRWSHHHCAVFPKVWASVTCPKSTWICLLKKKMPHPTQRLDFQCISQWGGFYNFHGKRRRKVSRVRPTPNFIKIPFRHCCCFSEILSPSSPLYLLPFHFRSPHIASKITLMPGHFYFPPLVSVTSQPNRSLTASWQHFREKSRDHLLTLTMPAVRPIPPEAASLFSPIKTGWEKSYSVHFASI